MTQRLRARSAGGPARALLAALGALVLLPSCFTVSAWGGTLEPNGCDGTFELQLVGGHRLSDNLLVMFLVTPFTVSLDVVTACPQAVLFGWRDDYWE